MNTIIVFLSSYLFLADHDKLVETVRKVIPEPVIKYGRMMKNDIRTLIGGYFLAQFKIMFVVAVVLVDRNVIPQGFHMEFFLESRSRFWIFCRCSAQERH